MNIEGALPDPERPKDNPAIPDADSSVPQLGVSPHWEGMPTGPHSTPPHRSYRIVRSTNNPKAPAAPADHPNAEHSPVAYTAPREAVSDDAAQEAAWHLERDGSLEHVTPDAVTDKTRDADDAAKRYLAQSRRPGDRAAVVAGCHHQYRAAKAGSLDEVRAMASDYDRFFPNETPQERLVRKQALLSQWDSVQVLRGRAASDTALTPEVSGPQHMIPEGFDLIEVQSLPLTVAYPTTYDALEAVSEYEARAALPESGPLQIEEDPALDTLKVGSWRVEHYKHPPRSEVTTRKLHRDGLGATPIERFAYAMGKPVNYAREFNLSFRAPMPDDLWQKREQARTRIPLQRFAQMVGAVMGQELITDVAPNKSWPGTIKFSGPSGSIRFEGDVNEDGTIGVGMERYAQNYADPFLRPGFSVVATLDRDVVTPDEVRLAAQRLSAWTKQTENYR